MIRSPRFTKVVIVRIRFRSVVSDGEGFGVRDHTVGGSIDETRPINSSHDGAFRLPFQFSCVFTCGSGRRSAWGAHGERLNGGCTDDHLGVEMKSG